MKRLLQPFHPDKRRRHALPAARRGLHLHHLGAGRHHGPHRGLSAGAGPHLLQKGPTRILGWFATAYIELFRNTPYLLWIFICVVFCPCPGFFARKMFGLTSVEMKLLFKAALALILFNSSVIAEIVRGAERRVQGSVWRPAMHRASTPLRCCSTSSCRRPTATSCRPAQPGHHHHQGTPPIWQMWPPSS